MSMTPLRPFVLRGGRIVLDGNVVLEDVDFSMASGEFVALLGGNGAGKTTLVKALLGLIPLRSGSLEVFATPIERFRERYRIGYVPQRMTAAAGVPATVWEVVSSGRASRMRLMARSGNKDREAVRRALDAVRLTGNERQSVATLSGGQQQRTLIARALAAEPDVLVLDEPASGVDIESQEALAAGLGELREQGRSILLVTHGLGAMEPLVDRTVVLDSGRVVYDGPPLIPREGLRYLHLHPEYHPTGEHVHHHPEPEKRGLTLPPERP
jgi:zinc transport system ATP-binding protein